ncbi:MAG: LPS export ABC transporter permease LptG, partial [Gammaproteobacteria bacterium]|nr:LPS export ABC transporter permease LptG [Gammaproteobacteria bacterium]
MRLLDRYIGRTIVAAIAIAGLVLLGLFTFITFVEELSDVGTGQYGFPEVISYVAMKVPRLAYELFPVAALIGALIGLTALSRSAELVAMRAAGVARGAIVLAVLKAGLLFVVLAIVLGEFVSPYTEQYARSYSAAKKSGQVATRTGKGFWARDGNSYINIKAVLPGDTLEGVYIYEFDDDARLRTSTYARSASYVDGQWVLSGIRQTEVAEHGVVARQIEQASWNSVLRPELLSIVAVKPEILSVWSLVRYIEYLDSNNLETRLYQHAMWAKIFYPAATAVMVFLAVPLVLS